MHPSLWEKESFYSPSDIIIAGNGFTGLWSAYYIKKKYPRLSVTIVDRGIIPTGASTRNAGFACFGSVTELVKDTAMMGEDRMLWLVEMRYKGLSKIRKVFRKKDIDYINSGGYEIIPSTKDDRYKELEWQVKWLNKTVGPVLGQKKIYRFADDKINEFGLAEVGHIISNDLEGCLHPGKLCQGLQRLVVSMGVNILSGLTIERFEENNDAVTLYTDRNLSLKADQLLVCTNGFARQLLPQLQINPARGQILVTSPIDSLKLKGTFHYDEGFYYFRNVGKRLLIGGARNMAIENETTTELEITGQIQNTLEEFVARHILPGTPFNITDRWSGIMGVGSEKMPIIKKLSPKVFCAVKMSGMGVALAPVAADTVTDLMR
jgi:glycine/D-amino acid oxidase-like deaminating enzyme